MARDEGSWLYDLRKTKYCSQRIHEGRGAMSHVVYKCVNGHTEKHPAPRLLWRIPPKCQQCTEPMEAQDYIPPRPTPNETNDMNHPAYECSHGNPRGTCPECFAHMVDRPKPWRRVDFLARLPPNAGTCVGMVEHKGRIIIACQFGIFEYHPDEAAVSGGRLEQIMFVNPSDGTAIEAPRSTPNERGSL